MPPSQPRKAVWHLVAIGTFFPTSLYNKTKPISIIYIHSIYTLHCTDTHPTVLIINFTHNYPLYTHQTNKQTTHPLLSIHSINNNYTPFNKSKKLCGHIILCNKLGGFLLKPSQQFLIILKVLKEGREIEVLQVQSILFHRLYGGKTPFNRKLCPKICKKIFETCRRCNFSRRIRFAVDRS